MDDSVTARVATWCTLTVAATGRSDWQSGLVGMLGGRGLGWPAERERGTETGGKSIGKKDCRGVKKEGQTREKHCGSFGMRKTSSSSFT